MWRIQCKCVCMRKQLLPYWKILNCVLGIALQTLCVYLVWLNVFTSSNLSERFQKFSRRVLSSKHTQHDSTLICCLQRGAYCSAHWQCEIIKFQYSFCSENVWRATPATAGTQTSWADTNGPPLEPRETPRWPTQHHVGTKEAQWSFVEPRLRHAGGHGSLRLSEEQRQSENKFQSCGITSLIGFSHAGHLDLSISSKSK